MGSGSHPSVLTHKPVGEHSSQKAALLNLIIRCSLEPSSVFFIFILLTFSSAVASVMLGTQYVIAEKWKWANLSYALAAEPQGTVISSFISRMLCSVYLHSLHEMTGWKSALQSPENTLSPQRRFVSFPQARHFIFCSCAFLIVTEDQSGSWNFWMGLFWGLQVQTLRTLFRILKMTKGIGQIRVFFLKKSTENTHQQNLKNNDLIDLRRLLDPFGVEFSAGW